MNKHFETLELHKILDMLSEQAGNDETRRMIAALEPETDTDKVKETVIFPRFQKQYFSP